MSTGVGPPSDVSLHRDDTSTTATTGNPPPRRRVYFTYHHLNSLAIVIILSATGTTTLGDIAFVVFSTLYIFFLSRFSFPAVSSDPPPPVFGATNKILRIYVTVGGIIGVILSEIYVFSGIFQGVKDGIQAAATPLFLLASQILMEGVSFSVGFSIPIRACVPIFYNSWRMLSIMEWVRIEFAKEELDRNRVVAGKALAAANLGFWGFNLFGFLLPYYLPKALKIHYSSSSSNNKKD